MAQQNQNPKTQGTVKNLDHSETASNNPVKKEGIDKRDTRENQDKTNQNLGSQKYRESSVSPGRQDSSAR
jgi:hypothetical protein